MEQHHPIMDKLGDLGGRTYRQTEMALWLLLQDYINFMIILQELKNKGIENILESLKIYLKAFKDNSCAWNWHVRWNSCRKWNILMVYIIIYDYIPEIKLYLSFRINTFNQIADILANPLHQNNFMHCKKTFCNGKSERD